MVRMRDACSGSTPGDQGTGPVLWMGSAERGLGGGAHGVGGHAAARSTTVGSEPNQASRSSG